LTKPQSGKLPVSFTNKIIIGITLTQGYSSTLTAYFKESTNLDRPWRTISLACGLGGIAMAFHTTWQPSAIRQTSASDNSGTDSVFASSAEFTSGESDCAASSV